MVVAVCLRTEVAWVQEFRKGVLDITPTKFQHRKHETAVTSIVRRPEE